MKKIFGDAEHKIYTGVRSLGNTTVAFGKCRCGLVMMDEEAIEEHQALIIAEEKKFPEENNG